MFKSFLTNKRGDIPHSVYDFFARNIAYLLFIALLATIGFSFYFKIFKDPLNLFTRERMGIKIAKSAASKIFSFT